MRKSFIFKDIYFNAVNGLNDADRLSVYDAICQYALNQNETKLEGFAEIVFSLIKPDISRGVKMYENGTKGGRPKNQTETKTKPKDNQTYNQNETIGYDLVLESKKPTLKEKVTQKETNPKRNITPFVISPKSGEENTLVDENEKCREEFFAKYPKFAKDRNRKDALFLNYKRLLEEFELSSYCRTLYTFKQVIDDYDAIIKGAYRDEEKKPSSVVDADARAERERWYAERRQKALGDAERIRNRFMQDETFAKIDKRLRVIEVEWAKAEVKGDNNTLAKLEREKARLSLQKRGIIERNGMTEEDLEPKWNCAKCKDTGFVDGLPCDCYEGA
jgi:hypothetical protein